ncbi:hypothetical protein ACHAXM_001547 [Skeletonema potamos]
MNSTQVGILKETNKVCLTRLLQGQNGSGLKPQIRLEILSNLTNETLEGCLADQKVGGLLILADLTKSDGTGTITVGFLHSSGGGGGLASGLGGELFAGGFSSGGFTCGLLGAEDIINRLGMIKKKRNEEDGGVVRRRWIWDFFIDMQRGKRCNVRRHLSTPDVAAYLALQSESTLPLHASTDEGGGCNNY